MSAVVEQRATASPAGERPIRRAVIVSVIAVLMGSAVVSAFLGLQAHAYLTAKARATATAEGRVVADGIGDNGDIRVRWTDAAGRIHVQRFGVYDTDKYRRGAAFPVQFDSTAAHPTGYAGDSSNDVRGDDLTVPIGVVAAAAALLLLGWGIRWLWWRRSARRPATPMRARILSGEYNMLTAPWLELTGRHPMTGERVTRWQRVMWHPAIDDIRGWVDVEVHGDVARRRRAVVDLADGTRLFPSSRLRHAKPRAWSLTDRESARDDLAEAFIVPAAATLHPTSTRWWRRVLAWAGIAVVAGGVAGVLIGGVAAVVPFAVGAGAVVTHVWAFCGGDPTA